MQHPIAIVDTETTGLDPDRHTVWEIAVIRRDETGEREYLWQIPLSEDDLAAASDEALRVGRYWERRVNSGADAVNMLGPDGPESLRWFQLDDLLTTLLDGATLVGSNPAFDAAFLRARLGDAPWHYRTVDIATLAAGYLTGRRRDPIGRLLRRPAPAMPYSSRALSRAVGVEPPGADEAHTALGDARWAARVLDAVGGGA